MPRFYKTLACLIVIAAAGLTYTFASRAEDGGCGAAHDQKQRYACYEQYFADAVKIKGAAAALARLDQLSQADPYVESQCHPLVHVIGRTALAHYGSVKEAARHASEICWSGYYHGIMESYMAEFDDQQLLDKMPGICEPDADRAYTFAYYNCLHGLGHGVTIRFNNDIFKALPYCEAIGKRWETQSCYGGVYMQNIVTDGENHVAVNLKPDDPIYPCNAVKDSQKEQCFLMQTSYMLKIYNYDYQMAFAACDSVEQRYVSACYMSMGRDISGNNLLDPVPVIAYCNLGQPAYRASCYIGAAKNAVFNDHNTKMATRLCEQVDPRFTHTCLTARDEAAATL